MKYEKEKGLVTLVNDKLEKNSMESYRMQSFLNLAYYSGKQWVTIDPNTKNLVEPPKESWQVRLVANRVQPIVRTELAKITKNKPICEVVPASNDENDVESARTSEKICRWLEHDLGLQNIDREICLDGLVLAMGFVKPFWNKNKGDEIIDPETGDKYNLGDIDIDIVSMFDVNFDMSANSWKDVRWIAHQKAKSVDEIFEIYNVKVEAEKDMVSTNAFDSRINGLNSNFDGSGYKKLDNCAMVKEYCELPSAKHPKGRIVTIAGDKVLYYSEDIGFGNEDTSKRELPYFPFVHIRVPGRVVGQSIIEHLIPIQREYNKSRSQIIQHKNLMSSPKWLVESNSLTSDITDAPGEIIEYKKGFTPPVMTQPQTMGTDVYKNLEQLIDEFYFISGQQEVSHGGTPPGVKSGVAIRFLQEQDDTKLGPTIANFIDYKNAYMSYMLKIIRYKYDLERTINIVGEDNKVEAVTFKGSDITSTTVRVQEGSMFQTSKPAKQQFIFDLVNSGVLNPQTDRALIIRMLELGITEDLYDENNIDLNKAKTENELWKKGNVSPIVRDFYNHTIHIVEHNKFRKSDDYEQLPPEMQQFINAHVEEHEAFLMPQSPLPQAPTDVKDLMSELTDEELEAISNNPEIYDEYMRGGGGNGQM